MPRMYASPVEKVSALLSDLENALDECYAAEDCDALKLRFIMRMQKQVEAISQGWNAETGEQEDLDSYLSNREDCY